nr:MAG TPA: hypothetical protein [Caudoviricetes sp.]
MLSLTGGGICIMQGRRGTDDEALDMSVDNL